MIESYNFFWGYLKLLYQWQLGMIDRYGSILNINRGAIIVTILQSYFAEFIMYVLFLVMIC